MKNGSMENLEMKRIVAACAGAWSPRLASSAWQQVLPGLLRFCQCLLQIQMPRPEPPQSLNLQVDPTGHSQGFLDLRSVPFNQKCRSKWFEMCHSLSHALKVQSTKACLGQREFSQLESRVSRSIHYDHDVGHGNIKQGQGIRTWKKSGNIQSYICAVNDCQCNLVLVWTSPNPHGSYLASKTLRTLGPVILRSGLCRKQPMMELMEDEARNALRQVLLRTSVEHHRGIFGINGGYVDTNPSNYYIVYTKL